MQRPSTSAVWIFPFEPEIASHVTESRPLLSAIAKAADSASASRAELRQRYTFHKVANDSLLRGAGRGRFPGTSNTDRGCQKIATSDTSAKNAAPKFIWPYRQVLAYGVKIREPVSAYPSNYSRGKPGTVLPGGLALGGQWDCHGRGHMRHHDDQFYRVKK